VSAIPEVLTGRDRGYIFVEGASNQAFRSAFKHFGDAYSGPMPTSGGMINDELELRWGARKFFLISFGKDLAGWSKLIKGHCAETRLSFVEYRHGRFLLNGAAEVSVDALNFHQH
jgi:hypothetical protein